MKKRDKGVENAVNRQGEYLREGGGREYLTGPYSLGSDDAMLRIVIVSLQKLAAWASPLGQERSAEFTFDLQPTFPSLSSLSSFSALFPFLLLFIFYFYHFSFSFPLSLFFSSLIILPLSEISVSFFNFSLSLPPPSCQSAHKLSYHLQQSIFLSISILYR